jgi:hypothetical protein
MFFTQSARSTVTFLFRLLCLLPVAAAAGVKSAEQPVNAALIGLSELKAGMKGEVWTVFQGTQPEPFSVEVTGVIQNALGPGKSIILCQLTDPRVQNMGAVAGMSGSPLYIDGKFAGALSYQIQRFETVRYAGFTPAADLAEVTDKTNSSRATGHASPDGSPSALVENDSSMGRINPVNATASEFQPLRPAITLGGLSPTVAELFAPQFAALGLSATSLGGSSTSSAGDPTPDNPQSAIHNPQSLQAGSAVSVALATGDITLAGTGTVSRVDGRHVTAFGHPMLALGEVDLPMCSAEIVAILPSNLQSFKIANTGAVIGTISQDRLSAVSGLLGDAPAMIPVEVDVSNPRGATRTLKFSVVRQAQLTPALVAAGVSQAILGSNDAGLSEGFRISSDVAFPAGKALASETIYAGPQAFAQGLGEFVRQLSTDLQNPYEKTFPDHVRFTVEPLEQNPAAVLDLFQLSRTTAHAGEIVQATLAWRDWQGDAHRETVNFTVDPRWVGKTLDVVLAPGRLFDELTGRSRQLPAAQLRSFDAYLAAQRDDRHTDGLYLAVAENAPVFTDQTTPTLELPGSFERIARGADEARYQKRELLVSLWETQVLPGRIFSAQVTRRLRVIE